MQRGTASSWKQSRPVDLHLVSHAILCKLTVLHGTPAGFWPIKFCLWVFALGICFAMPNHTFSGYGQLARVLSGIWLVFQIIILVDFVYRINEWLLSKVECFGCMYACLDQVCLQLCRISQARRGSWVIKVSDHTCMLQCSIGIVMPYWGAQVLHPPPVCSSVMLCTPDALVFLQAWCM